MLGRRCYRQLVSLILAVGTAILSVAPMVRACPCRASTLPSELPSEAAATHGSALSKLLAECGRCGPPDTVKSHCCCAEADSTASDTPATDAPHGCPCLRCECEVPIVPPVPPAPQSDSSVEPMPAGSTVIPPVALPLPCVEPRAQLAPVDSIAPLDLVVILSRLTC